MDSTDAVVEALRTRGFNIYVADLMEEVHSPDSLPIDGNVAILMGAELTGVSDRARELADGAICVPMHGLTESLNVSVAAACILQRLTERKRVATGGGDLPRRAKTSSSRSGACESCRPSRGCWLGCAGARPRRGLGPERR